MVRDLPVVARLLRRSDARLLRSMAGAAPWCLDRVEVVDGRLQVTGWALREEGGGPGLELLINGSPFDECQLQGARPDLAGIFWYVPDAARSGFSCSVDLAKVPPAPWEIARVDAHGEPFNVAQSYYWDPAAAADMPLPPAGHRERVHGGADADSFALEGFSTHRKLERAIRAATGRSLSDFESILDWGCGCGRSTRFLAGLSVRVTGIDIDGPSIEWCRDNLGFGTFLTSPLTPPTSLPDGSFDLLIGISVFSHLDRVQQELWLQELHRLAAMGAILAMSVHGPQSIARAALSRRSLGDWLDHGFFDIGANFDLEAVLVEADYYRDVGQSHADIRRHWGGLFEILEIVPGSIGNHQDLVLMTPRVGG